MKKLFTSFLRFWLIFLCGTLQYTQTGITTVIFTQNTFNQHIN